MSHHVESLKTYYRVYGALMGLLLLTLLASLIAHRAGGVVVAVMIAVTKAVLIVLFFMHVRHSTSLIRVCAVAGLFGLLLLLTLTSSDYLTRWPVP